MFKCCKRYKSFKKRKTKIKDKMCEDDRIDQDVENQNGAASTSRRKSDSSDWYSTHSRLSKKVICQVIILP